jgi:hypothetical protein
MGRELAREMDVLRGNKLFYVIGVKVLGFF